MIYDRVVRVALPITSDRLAERRACALCDANAYMCFVCVVSIGGEDLLFSFAAFWDMQDCAPLCVIRHGIQNCQILCHEQSFQWQDRD